jgi:hypothetical protein
VKMLTPLSFGESVGIAFASFFSTLGLSVSLVSTFLTFASFASSVFSASIAKFLTDIAFAFPMKYAAHIMLQNEMTGLSFNCDEASIQSGACTATTGQQVLDLFHLKGSTANLTGIMIAVTFAYRIAAWAILALRWAVAAGQLETGPNCSPQDEILVIRNNVLAVFPVNMLYIPVCSYTTSQCQRVPKYVYSFSWG